MKSGTLRYQNISRKFEQSMEFFTNFSSFNYSFSEDLCDFE